MIAYLIKAYKIGKEQRLQEEQAKKEAEQKKRDKAINYYITNYFRKDDFIKNYYITGNVKKRVDERLIKIISNSELIKNGTEDFPVVNKQGSFLDYNRTYLQFELSHQGEKILDKLIKTQIEWQKNNIKSIIEEEREKEREYINRKEKHRIKSEYYHIYSSIQRWNKILNSEPNLKEVCKEKILELNRKLADFYFNYPNFHSDFKI